MLEKYINNLNTFVLVVFIQMEKSKQDDHTPFYVPIVC